MSSFFNQSDFQNYMFFKFPRAIMGKKSKYKDLSDSARILYMLFYDRLTYSMEKRRFDKNGDIYIFFTLNQIIEETGWSREKARRALAALEEYNLIVQKRDKTGLAFRIYVRKLVDDDDQDEEQYKNHDSEVDSKRDQGGIETSPGVVSKRDLIKNYKSRTIESRYNSARARVTQTNSKGNGKFNNFSQRDYSPDVMDVILEKMCGDTG